MKKLLTLACAAIATTAFAAAPIMLPKDGYTGIMPKEFGYQGASTLQVFPSRYDEMEMAGEVIIYNEDLNQIATISLDAKEEVTLKGWSQRREGRYNPETNEYEYVWGEIQNTSYTEYVNNYVEIYFYVNGLDGDNCVASQTAFNSDSKFEYLKPKWAISYFTSEDEYEKRGGEQVITTGFKVINEDGQNLYDIDIPAEYITFDEVNIITLGNKKHLVVDCRLRNDEHEYVTLIYALGEQGGISSPKIVSAGMKVNPTMPRHGESVRVDLGEAASHVDLISANGAKVRSVAVKGDSRSVVIPTEGLASGVYVVTANSREAAKIIIR